MFLINYKRTLINQAIREGILRRRDYPFGKPKNGLYAIPVGNNTKKALTIDQIKTIIDHEINEDNRKEMARDFWLLSFYCGGINAADMLRLRNKDFNGESITFIREKTKGTRLTSKQTIIYLTPHAKAIIAKYRRDSTKPNQYLFPVLTEYMSSEKKKRRVNDFNCMVRKEMNVLSQELGIPIAISMMHARHSFANVAWNKRVPVSYIADCMSHSTVQTTSSYLKSISDVNKSSTMNTIFEDF